MPEMKIENGENESKAQGGFVKAFLQVSDIQKMMGISRTAAYALVRQKSFPCVRVGNRIVIPCDLFDEWVIKTAMSGRG